VNLKFVLAPTSAMMIKIFINLLFLPPKMN
jgi:hypothetical protein